MTEHELQHAVEQKDHNVITTYPAWTVIRLGYDDWPSYPRWADCYDWCIATWGRNDEWVYQGPGTFHFKNKSDAAMFILKWS